MVVKASELSFLESSYPRVKVHDYRVNELAEALRAGAEFPPIILDQNKSIIDGVHRWKAYTLVNGKDAKINAEIWQYKSDRDRFIDSVSLNSTHGLPLSQQEKERCMEIASKLGIDGSVIAKTLCVTYTLVKKKVSQKISYQVNKVPLSKLQKERVDKALEPKEPPVRVTTSSQPICEVSAAERLSTQLIDLIENNRVNVMDRSGMKKLLILHGVIDTFLKMHKMIPV